MTTKKPALRDDAWRKRLVELSELIETFLQEHNRSAEDRLSMLAGAIVLGTVGRASVAPDGHVLGLGFLLELLDTTMSCAASVSEVPGISQQRLLKGLQFLLDAQRKGTDVATNEARLIAILTGAS